MTNVQTAMTNQTANSKQQTATLQPCPPFVYRDGCPCAGKPTVWTNITR